MQEPLRKRSSSSKSSSPSSGVTGQCLFNILLSLVVVAAFILGVVGTVLGNNALASPTGYGNAFTETSPNVNLTDAPGVSELFLIFGFTLLPGNFGFGSMSGRIVTTSSGPQNIVISNPLSTIANQPIVIGAIPGLLILAVDNTTTYPILFQIAPTPYDVTLVIPDIVPGTWLLTQPFFGASKNV